MEDNEEEEEMDEIDEKHSFKTKSVSSLGK